ncbi:hypothetical protein [Streptomyces sp. NPDC003943]
MKYFGFYDDAPYRIGAATSAAALPRGPVRGDRRALARYLAGCERLTVVPGVETDPYDGCQVMGGFSLHTDGVWCWPGMAARMVREHGLAVPAELEESAAARGFVAPVLGHEEIVALFREVRGELW